MLDWYRKAHEYKDRAEIAEERVRQLLEIMRPKVVFPAEWSLTPAETRFLAAIGLRGEITKEAAGIAIVKNLDADIDGSKLVEVTVFRVRRKVTPFGIKIGTAWGQGYYLVGQSREIIKAALRVAGDVENNEQTRERTAQE